MRIKHTIFLLISVFLLLFQPIFAQRLSVESFVESVGDMTAAASSTMRLDGNNVPCALVKVHLPIQGASFRGNTVGSVDYHVNQYWVYLTEGSKQLSVDLAGYYQLNVRCTDYNIPSLKSKVTYDLTLVASGQEAQPNKEEKAVVIPKKKIRYEVIKDELYVQLNAFVDGQQYNIDEPNDICEIIDVYDYNKDGIDEVIYGISPGGQAPMSINYAEYKGNGFFSINSLDNSYFTPTVEDWNDQRSILVKSSNSSATTLNRYAYQNNKMGSVDKMTRSNARAVKELLSSQFPENSEWDDEISMDFDLDGDGVMDQVCGLYNERWGEMTIDVRFGNGKRYKGNCCYKRIGILSSITNGVHDLVAGDANVLRWDGTKYIDPNEPPVSVSGTAQAPVLEEEKDNGYDNGHEYVDLGLPSGLKWATCNVGANSPEEYGDYYAWGETKPKRTYDWSTYKWCNGSNDSLTKYCNEKSFGTVDNKTVLDLSDDAAHVNWGGSWRMPTFDELKELQEKCIWVWTTQNGISGSIVTGPNGNSIFLPAARYCDNTSLGGTGLSGNYWSSLIADYTTDAFHFYFNSSGVDWFYDGRCCGFSVRPVR